MNVQISECYFIASCQPIFATANMVADFATQFVKIEAKNAQLRKELAASKSLAE
jgi:hypothetical protein